MPKSTSENTIVGYAAVFNRMSSTLNIGGGFREILLFGCFKDTLTDGHDIKCLIGHDTKLILGSTVAKTLKLREDKIGLAFQLTLNRNISYANDIYLAVDRGDVRGMSFQCLVPTGFDSFTVERGTNIRRVSKVTINEISITGFPAYPDSSVDISRSAEMYGISAKPIVKNSTTLKNLARLEYVEGIIKEIKANDASSRLVAARLEYANALKRDADRMR